MNKQNAHEYLPLVQALADGKTLQRDFHEYWADSEEILFDMKPEFYRIKPKPRTFRIVRSRNTGDIYNAVNHDGSSPTIWEYITVQEVAE